MIRKDYEFLMRTKQRVSQSIVGGLGRLHNRGWFTGLPTVVLIPEMASQEAYAEVATAKRFTKQLSGLNSIAPLG